MSRTRFGRTVLLGLLVWCGCVGTNPGESTPRASISDGWLAMGTFFEAELLVDPGEEARARTWLAWAHGEIAHLEKTLSRHDPDSAVSALNRRLASPDALRLGARVDSEIESVLFSAIEVWEATGGAFDITVGPLVEIWTRAAEIGEWPTVEALRRAKSHVGSEGLLLLGGGELGVTKPAMRIDLDAISKGAVLDRLWASLESDLPRAAALLSFGESSVVAIGDPGGGGWRLIARPEESPVGPPVSLRLRDQALSVSSSIGSTSEIAGERISHVVDPRTGSVIRETVEAIVVADRASIADAWSTGLLVIGANRNAGRLIDRAGIEARVADSSGRYVTSEGWEAFVARGPRAQIRSAD